MKRLSKAMKEIKSISPKRKVKDSDGVSREVYSNDDGAVFYDDTDEIVEGSCWDYPGSPYSDDYED